MSLSSDEAFQYACKILKKKITDLEKETKVKFAKYDIRMPKSGDFTFSFLTGGRIEISNWEEYKGLRIKAYERKINPESESLISPERSNKKWIENRIDFIFNPFISKIKNVLKKTKSMREALQYKLEIVGMYGGSRPQINCKTETHDFYIKENANGNFELSTWIKMENIEMEAIIKLIELLHIIS